MGKAVVAAISLVLVVGAVIGAVVIIKHRSNNETVAGGGGSGSGIMTGMKAVDTLCSPDDVHKDLCVETLSPVAKGDANATPRAFVEAAFQAIMKAVQNAINETNSLDKDAKDKFDVSSLGVCKDFIGYAAEDVEMALSSLVPQINMTRMGDLARELKIFLGAVLSSTSTCVDEMENLQLKEALEGGVLLNTTRLAENGLAIVDGVAEFLDNVNVDIMESSGKKPQRRLLDVGEDGYPTWLSASERKLLQGQKNPLPNVIVAKDGSGQFTTIQEAVNSFNTKMHKGRYVIYVKRGIYEENVRIHENMRSIYMYGDGPQQTIVTGRKNKAIMKIDTPNTATFSVVANRFVAKSMGFRNTAGPQGQQAVALLTRSRQTAYYDCAFDGHQDTLCYDAHKAFFRKCVISGTIDFIFGKGDALIQDSDIIVKLPDVTIGQYNVITADGNTKPRMPGGLVIQNCKIMAEPALIAHKNKITYLGRPWGQYAMTLIMESELPDVILPEGYIPWKAPSTNHLTATYKEFANTGPGAASPARVEWPSFEAVTDKKKVEIYTARHFIIGHEWLPQTGIPHYLDFAR